MTKNLLLSSQSLTLAMLVTFFIIQSASAQNVIFRTSDTDYKEAQQLDQHSFRQLESNILIEESSSAQDKTEAEKEKEEREKEEEEKKKEKEEEKCPVGQFYNKLKQSCQMCHETCRECKGVELFDCITCYKNELLENGYCVDKCQQDYFIEKQQCLKCQHPCEQCDSLTDCKYCILGYYLRDNECVSRCPVNYYKNEMKRTCIKCGDPRCKTCEGTGFQQCIECFQDQEHSVKLYKGICYKTYKGTSQYIINSLVTLIFVGILFIIGGFCFCKQDKKIQMGIECGSQYGGPDQQRQRKQSMLGAMQNKKSEFRNTLHENMDQKANSDDNFLKSFQDAKPLESDSDEGRQVQTENLVFNNFDDMDMEDYMEGFDDGDGQQRQTIMYSDLIPKGVVLAQRNTLSKNQGKKDKKKRNLNDKQL